MLSIWMLIAELWIYFPRTTLYYYKVGNSERLHIFQICDIAGIYSVFNRAVIHQEIARLIIFPVLAQGTKV